MRSSVALSSPAPVKTRAQYREIGWTGKRARECVRLKVSRTVAAASVPLIGARRRPFELLPAMESRMTFPHRDECAAAGRASFPRCAEQGAFHGRAIA